MPPTNARPFRFVFTGARSGPRNMAIDEVVMSGLAEGWSSPIIRLYMWDPPTISIGFFQSAGDLDMERCEADGIGLVRRLTGGRAVLHSEELTYSILFGEEDFAPFKKKEIFLFIAQCLVDSLRLLGIESKIAEKSRGNLKSANCFAAPAQFEVESEREGKLIGSAQVIKDGVVLQHGAIPLTGSYRAISKYIRGGDTSFKSASFLNQAGGEGACEKDLVDCIRRAFGSRLRLTEEGLNDREIEAAEKLAEVKYESREWLHRR